MPASRTRADKIGQCTVHNHGLDRETVRRDPIQEIAHSLPAVEGKRRSLEVGIEGATQVVHHVLTDADRGIVMEQGQRSGAKLDEHYCCAGKQKQTRSGR